MFDSPQVKRGLISIIINFVYELPHTSYQTMRESLASSLSFKNKSVVIAAESYTEADIKFFCSCSLFFDFFTLPYQFFWDCIFLSFSECESSSFFKIFSNLVLKGTHSEYRGC